MRSFSPLSTLALVLFAALVGPSVGIAAENFACGPDGKPNPATAKCDCPTGKIEKTVNGISRCVAPTAPAPTSSGAPKPPPKITCAPGQILSGGKCVELCAADEKWNGSHCVPRCPSGQSWNGTACEAAPTKCPEGETADASGHCCYPGQVWGESTGRCRGKPQCPSGLYAEGEVCVVHCDEGMVRVAHDLHCCWPSQEWSSASNACVGEAQCPAEFEPQGDGCVRKPPECDTAGKVVLDDRHCCWPTQTWSTADGGKCAGVPACPVPLTLRGDDCVGPDVIAKEKEEADESAQVQKTADASAIWGAGVFSFGIYTAYQRAPGAFSSFTLGYHLALHLPAIPIAFDVGAGGGGFWTTLDSGVKTTGSVGDVFVGASFAPISYPNAAALDAETSWLNPSLGFEVHRFGFSTSQTEQPVPGLGSSGAGFITIANVIEGVLPSKDDSGIYDGRGVYGLRISYGYGVFGNDFARGSRVMLVFSAGHWW